MVVADGFLLVNRTFSSLLGLIVADQRVTASEAALRCFTFFRLAFTHAFRNS